MARQPPTPAPPSLPADPLSRQLHDTEQLMRAILHTAVDAIITINDRGLIESANPAAERLFGFPLAELIGNNVSMLMPEPYRHEHDSYLRNYLRTGTAKIIGIGREVTGIRKDGSLFPLSLAISEVHVQGRRLFTGIVHDLTERRRLEKQILEASTDQQRRIGQDLHDGLCQELVGLGFRAELLANQLHPADPAAAAAARDLGHAIRHAAGQARRLAHGLNPIDVKAGGLAGALAHLAAKVSDDFRVRCTFAADPAADVADDAAATHLYRIAQEAVGNAIRHGRASRIDIRLAAPRTGEVALTVTDNGRGFERTLPRALKRPRPPHADPPVAPPSPHGHPAGIGLQTMQYRARMIGGTFDIRPAAKSGAGTRVSCALGRAPAPGIPPATRKENPDTPHRPPSDAPAPARIRQSPAHGQASPTPEPAPPQAPAQTRARTRARAPGKKRVRPRHHP